MTTKSIPFKTPTGAPRTAEEWVRPVVKASTPAPAQNRPTKRLTVDIDEALHRRVKLDGVQRGLDISDIVRQLLADRYPDAVSPPSEPTA